MSTVFFDVGISLDGFIAGANRGPRNPLGDGGTLIGGWMSTTAALARTGACIMGRRTFDEGELGWSDDSPFEAPVFVLTHTPREPWVRPGGTTFHFVTGGIERALKQALVAAGPRDVRISGGAETIREYIDAGLVDAFTLHIAPTLLGSGLRLFDNLDSQRMPFTQTSASGSDAIVHANYRMLKPALN